MAITNMFMAETDCVDFILDVPKVIGRKKWRMAYTKIYSFRAFMSLVWKRAIPTKNLGACSYSVLEIETSNDRFSIDPVILSNLAKERNTDEIRRLGGVECIVSDLNSSKDDGICEDPEGILRRREIYGANTFHKPPTKRLYNFVMEAFQDVTILILMVCAGLSLGFGIKEDGLKEGWYDGGSIFLAVFLVVAVSAASNYRQSKQFDKLAKVGNNIQIEVIRNGRRSQISIFDIVVGDVVLLKVGDQVPADGLFLEGHCIEVDESSMTGESDHVEVDSSRNPFLISGTKVVDGYASMVVISVGMNTTWGEMMSSLSRDSDEETPLQTRLNSLTSSIGKVGLMVAFLLLIVLLVRFFTGGTTDENGNREFNAGNTKLNDIINGVLGIIATSVTIVVVAIPEGLPLAVTLTLAYSMKRMMEDQAMVRKLSACETMGSATTICTDKTGTLTTNKMEVTEFVQCSSVMADLIQQGVALNTTGSVFKSGSGFEFSGSPTEKAILKWCVSEMGLDFERIKQNFTVLQVEAFNSEKKKSGVLVSDNGDNSLSIHWKGAAEMILSTCSSYYDESGVVKDLDGDQMTKFKKIIESMAAKSLRCIAFARKNVRYSQENVEDDCLTLLCIVGLKDPCRPGVGKAVEDCQVAGVKVKMITGDNVHTAKAIAMECGILKDEATEEAVVEGEVFRNYTHEERMCRIEKISVMARSSPSDKLLMVQCLKQKGHVVAVTGDGTNDAPALKESDIGLSMGIQGTEVAKESSDIVILDDDFTSVVTVLRWGRCVYNNIQKFIQFQLTVNVAALAINFVAAVSAGKVPLTAVQLLWVNLIMDTLGALALATERPTKELMKKPPVGRSGPLITNVMWRNLSVQAVYQIMVLLGLQFGGEAIFGVVEKVNATMIFNTFVLCQVFNEFNARELEKKNVFAGVHRNKLFLGIVGITVILQVVMVEFLKKFADTERLNGQQWAICIGLASLSWPIGFVVKFIPVPENKFFSYFKCWVRKSPIM